MLIKLVLQNQIYITDKSNTISELHFFILNRFMLIEEKYVLTYVDIDGDTITMISDQDLKYLKETNNGKTIKIYVNVIEESKEKSRKGTQCNVNSTNKSFKSRNNHQNILKTTINGDNSITIQDTLQMESMKKLKQEYQMEKEQNKVQQNEQDQNQNIHIGIRCDGCNACPIVGIRYKCSICFDYDYCQKCQNTFQHQHNFIKIKKSQTNQDKVKLSKRDKKFKYSNISQKIQNKYQKVEKKIIKPLKVFAHILKFHPLVRSCVFKKHSQAFVLNRKQKQKSSEIQQQEIQQIKNNKEQLFDQVLDNIQNTQLQEIKIKSEQQCVIQKEKPLVISFYQQHMNQISFQTKQS